MRILAHICLAVALVVSHGVKASGRTPPARRPAVEAETGEPALVRAAVHDLGRGNFTGQRGPWCAFAVSAWLQRIGLPPLPGGMASSALRYGPHVAPRPGVLAVSWRHVGIVERVDGPWLITLNGNWGNRVRRARVPARAFAAFVEVRT